MRKLFGIVFAALVLLLALGVFASNDYYGKNSNAAFDGDSNDIIGIDDDNGSFDDDGNGIKDNDDSEDDDSKDVSDSKFLKNNRSVEKNPNFGSLNRQFVAAINSLRKEEFEKIRELKKESFEQLKNLDANDMAAVSKLRKDRIEAISGLKKDSLEKIKDLRTEDYWKLSNLDKNKLEALLDSNLFDSNLFSFLPVQYLDKLAGLDKKWFSELISELDDEELAALAQLDQNNINYLNGLSGKQLKQKLKGINFLNRGLLNYLKAKDNFEFKKESFLDSKQEFLDRKQEFLGIKEQLKNNTSDKNALRERLRQSTQLALINQVNAILTQLEMLLDKNVMLSDVNSLILRLESVRETLDGENISQEKIVSAAAEIKEIWAQLKLVLQKRVLEKMDLKLVELSEKSEKSFLRVQSDINALKQAGKDTNELDSLLLQYKEKIDAAESKESLVSGLLAQNELNEAKDAIKDSEKYFNDSFKILRKLFGLIGEAKEQ